ncbi:uncharacterized protein LOC133386098 [Rhineura floridana]|uniref:uncharacterized protein LOC133386098 n=1 Tax=Rhineura floridana TaxID=261503 RepID=UPI002AC85020|nr:uncharacterized protein LOC133386098 [Rhineura floridana]
MFKMDFRFSFLLPCMLVILTIIDGRACTDIIRIVGDIGGNISFSLESQHLSNISVTKEMNCSHSVDLNVDCCNDCDKRMCLRNGFLEMMNLSENDDGKYTIALGNDSKTFSLEVCELPLAIHIHCLSDGRANLSCEVDGQSNDSIYWTLNGRSINEADVCKKEGGKRIILEKGAHGKLVCHRRNTCSSSSIELSCSDGNDGDLLQHPLFLYILAACGGGALLLAIIASLITCCCMKSKHHFTPVPVEDEKDEGITLSAISSEGPKSPPNGDHCETTDTLVGSTINLGPETCEMDPNPTVEPELEFEPKTEDKDGTGTEFQEIMVDSAALETMDDCFPDPIDN